MVIIEICPKCSNPGIEVKNETVINLLKEAYKKNVARKDIYSICTNPVCQLSYFSKSSVFSVNDVKKSIWFKNTNPDVPICYCSNITRGEIYNAVTNGCETIEAVQKYTDKNITGNCLKENPLGKCCRNVFLFTMQKVRKIKREVSK